MLHTTESVTVNSAVERTKLIRQERRKKYRRRKEEEEEEDIGRWILKKGISECGKLRLREGNSKEEISGKRFFFKKEATNQCRRQ